MEKKLKNVIYFDTNSQGIIELKKEFCDEAKTFLFLRKGEDVGAILIATYNVLSVLIDNPYVQSFVISLGVKLVSKPAEKILKIAYNKFKIFFNRNNITKTKKVLRILCTPDNENEKARAIYDKFGFKDVVRAYKDKTKVGAHRYYVNDNRVCYFMRFPGDKFAGFITDDKTVRDKFTNLFDSEWDKAQKLS